MRSHGPTSNSDENVSPSDLQKLQTLIPDLRWRVRDVLRSAASYGADVAVISAARSQAEQDRLYAQGRTTPGAVVTWTRNSMHIGGRAVDLGFRVGGRVTWQVPDWWWEALGVIGTWHGLHRPVLGKGDLGHFEIDPRKTVR